MSDRAKITALVALVCEKYRETPLSLIIYDSKTKLIYNGDVKAEEADKLIAEGKIDAVTFGRSFIGNPDLPRRLQQGLPLNEAVGHPL